MLLPNIFFYFPLILYFCQLNVHFYYLKCKNCYSYQFAESFIIFLISIHSPAHITNSCVRITGLSYNFSHTSISKLLPLTAGQHIYVILLLYGLTVFVNKVIMWLISWIIRHERNFLWYQPIVDKGDSRWRGTIQTHLARDIFVWWIYGLYLYSLLQIRQRHNNSTLLSICPSLQWR